MQLLYYMLSLCFEIANFYDLALLKKLLLSYKNIIEAFTEPQNVCIINNKYRFYCAFMLVSYNIVGFLKTLAKDIEVDMRPYLILTFDNLIKLLTIVKK